MRTHIVLLTTAVTLSTAIDLRAQSLADVAASEAARRKAQTAPSKVYTNDTLAGVDAPVDVQIASGAMGALTCAGASAGRSSAAPASEPQREARSRERERATRQGARRSDTGSLRRMRCGASNGCERAAAQARCRSS